jgi:hypothetical protein
VKPSPSRGKRSFTHIQHRQLKSSFRKNWKLCPPFRARLQSVRELALAFFDRTIHLVLSVLSLTPSCFPFVRSFVRPRRCCRTVRCRPRAASAV